MKPPFQIKICGITTPNDAIAAMNCGVDAIGLNFYSQSSRFVTESQALQIMVDLADATETNSIFKPKVIGVFVNRESEEVARIVADCLLDGIQIHGDESPDFLPSFRKTLTRRHSTSRTENQCTIIRAIRCGELSGSNKSNVDDEIDRVKSEAQLWADEGIDAILLDAASSGQFGGTGKRLNWEFVSRLDFPLPVILAGGLNPDNVSQAIRTSDVRSVDVSSGVELAPGIKDIDKMRQFVHNTGWRSL